MDSTFSSICTISLLSRKAERVTTQGVSLDGVLRAFSQPFFLMISETYWKILEDANRNLAMRFETLQKARAAGDPQDIAQAQMEYLKALQILYTDVQNAVAQPMRFKS